ncbi:Acyl-CoA synthetase (AMP-forming)/AMP-acid ligase II [Roseivivax marinus]|uniref:class I adenylate-forming enzyme family protein n=1 Tax=Roseivivax marinus TaxID=1379903 RepID=UPI0008D7FB57|nr:class I adenylate-forming enzyme family protein [Roseivivax marinus]SEL05451.1 Acyl-CoA synthetase (AMP-forming)/AMP-acid ligase II [Roseivivax marinus]
MQAIFDGGPPPPVPTPFNLTAHVLEAGTADPDKVALAIVAPTGAERWSYGRLRAAVLGIAHGLRAQGLGPGERVLMRLGNDVAFPLAYLGAIAADLVPVPTSAQLTEREVAKIADHLAPSAVLRDPRVACPDLACPVYDTSDMVAWRDGPQGGIVMGDPNRLAYIVMTSGTSGSPRAVAHAHRAVWARRMMVEGWYGLRPSDRLAHAGAFNWTFTLGTGLLDPWAAGATAIIPADGVAPAQLPLLLKRHEATLFAAAPGVYRQMLKHAPFDLPKLRHGLSAGEKMPEALRDAWRAATGTEVYEAYGMSECSTFISAAPDRPAAPGTLGRPQDGRRVAILGPEGPEPLDTPGEIAVDRTDPGLMLGYVDAPEATAEKMNGSWFLTGDRGQMAADGTITYLGRMDDLMNAGGLRVSPLEIEEALLAHPGIDEVGAAEVEVKDGVRVIGAFWTGPEPLDDAALHAFASERLARYKCPRVWVRCDALPKSTNGKLQRRALPALRDPIHSTGERGAPARPV